MSVYTDEYADLPRWVRPGAALAALHTDRVQLVLVKHITATRVVCADGKQILRFRRDDLTMQGSPTTRLETRGHTEVVQLRVRDVVSDLRQAVRKAAMPPFSRDERPQEEIAAELLDKLEDLIGRARRKVANLIDPGGAVAAEYAAEEVARQQ